RLWRARAALVGRAFVQLPLGVYALHRALRRGARVRRRVAHRGPHRGRGRGPRGLRDPVHRVVHLDLPARSRALMRKARGARTTLRAFCAAMKPTPLAQRRAFATCALLIATNCGAPAHPTATGMTMPQPTHRAASSGAAASDLSEVAAPDSLVAV